MHLMKYIKSVKCGKHWEQCCIHSVQLKYCLSCKFGFIRSICMYRVHAIAHIYTYRMQAQFAIFKLYCKYIILNESITHIHIVIRVAQCYDLSHSFFSVFSFISLSLSFRSRDFLELFL